MAKTVYAIEGLDRLGKGTLISGILNREGFYNVIHFGKPEVLTTYKNAKQGYDEIHVPHSRHPLYLYQRESFINSMLIAKSGARVIFDRWHLGEFVYGPMYRAYPGDYVFDIEHKVDIQDADIRLILLLEDFEHSKHFESDGESFDDTKRRDEQELFVTAFNRSIIRDKRKVVVTDSETGGFRPKEDILEEVLA